MKKIFRLYKTKMNKVVSLKGYEPIQQTPWSAWYDIKARGTWHIEPNSVALIPVWVKVALDKGVMCLVFPRSSLPMKKGLMVANSVGVVDSDYRGEIHIQLYNFNDYEVIIEDMERIGQLIFTKYSDNIVECDNNDFLVRETKYPSKRGVWGFGSTGK